MTELNGSQPVISSRRATRIAKQNFAENDQPVGHGPEPELNPSSVGKYTQWVVNPKTNKFTQHFQFGCISATVAKPHLQRPDPGLLLASSTRVAKGARAVRIWGVWVWKPRFWLDRHGLCEGSSDFRGWRRCLTFTAT
jgi:hypothetical protein